MNPYSCDLERETERSGARKDAAAFKVSWAWNVWQTGVKHSRAEQSDPLCQPIGNEFGAWPVSHDSVFYGPRWRMTRNVPEHELWRINKDKERKESRQEGSDCKIKPRKPMITHIHTHTRSHWNLLGKQAAEQDCAALLLWPSSYHSKNPSLLSLSFLSCSLLLLLQSQL